MLTLLYPPILDTYLPAFVKDEIGGLTIPYSLSPYQEDIGELGNGAIHLSIQEQNTNISIIDTNLGIFEVGYTPDRKIELTSENAQPILEKLKINSYYKVQMRLASEKSRDKITSEFLNKKGLLLSEWSTVCLIKPISKPTLIFENNWIVQNDLINLKEKENGYFSGLLKFSDASEKEHLQEYRIKLLNKNHSALEDSGKVYTGSFNSNAIRFNYKTKLNAVDEYFLQVYYKTNNGYQDTLEYKFKVKDFVGELPYLNFDTEPIEDIGGIKVNFSFENKDSSFNGLITGNYIVTRASSEDGYSIWEDVYSFVIDTGQAQQNTLNFSWVDHTVAPGIFYKYGLQKINKIENEEVRGPRKTDKKNIVAINIEDIFLFDGEKSLKIQYNPTINSFKRNVLESKTDTLGSKYPFIKRNADVSYREFSIGGLISYNMDDINYNKIGAYNDQINTFESLPINSAFLNDTLLQKIPSKSNENTEVFLLEELCKNEKFDKEIYLEKVFRERVMDFLYADTVKLFKSETEGIMLVKLMNISLTPNPQLGRKVYSFSATAYEVDKPIFENYTKYGIIKIQEFQEEDTLFSTEIKVNQIIIPEDKNRKEAVYVSSLIKDKINNKTSINSIKRVNEYHLIKFTFEGEYELINNQFYGHRVKIGNSDFYTTNRVFQISSSDLKLSSDLDIYVYGKGQTIIDFIYDEISEINSSSLKNIVSRYTKSGQIWEFFNFKKNTINTDIVSLIKQKHNFQKNQIEGDKTVKRFFLEVSGVKGFTITARPGALFEIKDVLDSHANLAVVNSTGVMNYYKDGDPLLGSIYCKGVLLSPGNKNEAGFIRFRARDIEYQINNDSYEKWSDIKNPEFQTIYFIGNEAKIFFGKEWCDIYGNIEDISSKENKLTKNDFNSDSLPQVIVDTKVDVLMDYYIEISEGYSDIFSENDKEA